LHRLCETMHTALGEPGLMGDLADALLGVVTKSVENPKTFGPQSHVGLSSEGKLNSWSNSAPQSTGPTPHCPALGDIPNLRRGARADGQAGVVCRALAVACNPRGPAIACFGPAVGRVLGQAGA